MRHPRHRDHTRDNTTLDYWLTAFSPLGFMALVYAGMHWFVPWWTAR